MSRSADPIGRIVGILVFLAGIGLLAIVFKETYSMLTNPVPELAGIIHGASIALKPGQPPPPSAFPAVAAAVVAFFLKLALLFVGVIAGSIVSSKGIHLYFAAAGSVHPSTPPTLTLSETPSKSVLDPGPAASAALPSKRSQ